jgi:hypothetical protein
LDTDSLVKLEHSGTKDRIRKILFNRVDQIIVWRQMPAVRMIVVVIFLALPGLLLLLPREIATTIIAIILLLLAGIILAFYTYCRKTTIRIIRAGRIEDITGVFWPRKVQRLVAGMAHNIREVQARGFEAMAAKQTEAASASDGNGMSIDGMVPDDSVNGQSEPKSIEDESEGSR